MYNMSLPTLGFGILLLLQAALANSAPHISYSDIDEDEEALIDRLASLASSSRLGGRGGGGIGGGGGLGPDAFESSNKPLFADFDLPPIDYLSSSSSAAGGSDVLGKAAGLANLPRKFAYGPDDIRFYLPASQFPVSLDYQQQQQQQQQQRKYKSDLDLLESDLTAPASGDDENGEILRQQNALLQQNDLASSNEEVDGGSKIHRQRPQQQNEAGGGGGQGGGTNSLHYMKKSQPETIADGGGINYGVGSYASPTNEGTRGVGVPPAAAAAAAAAANSNSKTLSNNNESQSPFETHQHQNPNYIMASSHDANVPNPVYTAEKAANSGISSFYYIVIIAACSAAVVVGVVAAGICWYRIHERVKAAADVDYPAYGVTGPSKDVSPSGGDRKLAQSAHMYHYQHQKQQMAALQKTTMQGDRQGSGSDVESEDDNEDGDYTVYECPGLAGLCPGTGEMEVKNPLYEDEPTPATPHVVPTVEDPEPASSSSSSK